MIFRPPPTIRVHPHGFKPRGLHRACPFGRSRGRRGIALFRAKASFSGHKGILSLVKEVVSAHARDYHGYVDKFFKYDPQAMGAKGLVYIGKKIVVFRRAANQYTFPLQLDLPGGGPEEGETPFETYQREIKEELGLDIERSDIIYAKRYESRFVKGKFAHFPVAALPAKAKRDIELGEEGLEYHLMTPSQFLACTDVAWPVLQERTKAYLDTVAEARAKAR
jgi:8-oxo-dGTP diphosphatase